MRKPLSKGAKVGIGCGGVGCLGLVIIFVAAMISVVVGGASTSTDTQAEPAAASAVAETSAPASSSTSSTPTSSPTAEPGTALAMLAELDVKGRAPQTGYDADLFGWRNDTDHNGCDTRNDVLRRDLDNITLARDSAGCKVIAGSLDDPYKGEAYKFTREPNNIDIDHVVARSNAWQTGASKFDEVKLEAFGNDPLNLLAVDSSLNRQKGDADAATWLPPNKSFRCEYVARQIAVKQKYDLWVVEPEKKAMEKVLGDCDGQKAFTDEDAWPAPGEGDNVKTEPAPKPKPKPKKAPEPVEEPAPEPEPEPKSEYYENCSAARAAGAAPVRRGDPGYGDHLDRDGDGVACET